MQSYAPSKLVDQLSRNSTPYHDPVARIAWADLSRERFWLPPEALSLHGVAEFMSLPEESRRHVSHYEFLNFAAAGLWLEGLFMERIARDLRQVNDPLTAKYQLHELREEAGHSLMFLELIERSGLAFPFPPPRPNSVLSEWFARRAPLSSPAFWVAVLIGEEVPDRMNRFLRRHHEAVCPIIMQIATSHVIDEARHIAYTREILDARVPTWSRLARLVSQPVLRRLLRQFVAAFYYPEPEIYELAGLSPGRFWARRARLNPRRAAFVADCLRPTLHVLEQYGLALARR